MDTIFASTTQMAAAIQVREISAVELLDAHLAQIEKQNPALNAIVTLNADEARKRARAADVALARGECWGALHGVPFTLKDAFATAGMRTTTGFPRLVDWRATGEQALGRGAIVSDGASSLPGHWFVPPTARL
ncbi:MAG: amidase family protein [Caldilineaceae bacterium]